MAEDIIKLDKKIVAALIWEDLNKIHNCKEKFTVTFSGKKNKKVNGLYRPFDCSIIIHDKNFIDEEGTLNETALMYTAIHELAHHIQFTEYGQKGARSHTKLFHSIVDNLVAEAEAAGIYKPVIDEELQNLIYEAEHISIEIAELQQQLGNVLIKLNNACIKKGIRTDDVIQRKLKLTHETKNKVVNIAALDIPAKYGFDIQEMIAAERSAAKREEMIAAAEEMKSAYQVKQTASPSGQSKGESEMDNLLREKERIENQIENLKHRLIKIINKIEANEAALRCAAERRNE